jgi:hypothetical protein
MSRPYGKGQAPTIDTEIRHVTTAGANLFLELGFTAAEAKKLHAASRKQINDTRLLKQQPMVLGGAVQGNRFAPVAMRVGIVGDKWVEAQVLQWLPDSWVNLTVGI